MHTNNAILLITTTYQDKPQDGQMTDHVGPDLLSSCTNRVSANADSCLSSSVILLVGVVGSVNRMSFQLQTCLVLLSTNHSSPQMNHSSVHVVD